MKQKITFTFDEEYFPTPRSKKTRTRQTEGTATASIREVEKEDAPLVMRIKYDDNDVMEIRSFNGKLYRNVQGRSFEKAKDVNISQKEMDWQRLVLGGVEYRICIDNRPSCMENIVATIRREARKYLVVDGMVFERTEEPIYTIVHFGINTNAAMSIEWDCKASRNRSSTYSALEREKCHETLKKILSRCSEKYDNSERVNIEVLDKSYVKFKRNIEYA